MQRCHAQAPVVAAARGLAVDGHQIQPLGPGQVEATNNACERDLRPAVVQREVTNGYHAMWAAQGEADIRTVIDTARLIPGTNRFQTVPGVVSA